MLLEQNIESQQELLVTYRRTLLQLCKQVAQYGGESFVPPYIVNGIHEARDNIWRIKSILRSYAVTVYDEPNDGPINICSPSTTAAAYQQLAGLPVDKIPEPSPLPLGSRMPFNHNPLFVGRSEELLTLATSIKMSNTAAISQIAAATGLGGIGKTQLACEFAYRYGAYFAGGVFWLNFADPDAIPGEIRACGGAGCMELRSDFERMPPEDQVRLVRAAWQSTIPRLLIFDNCEDEGLLATWRPIKSGCHVLVTSRRSQWDITLNLQVVPLNVLYRKESLALLSKYHPDLSASISELAEIAIELGDLPLALHLAGSFLARYRHVMSPADYLQELRSSDLLQHPSLQGRSSRQETSPTYHLQHVGRTFALSYERLDPRDRVDGLARSLLAHAAHFEPGSPVERTLLLALLDLLGDTTRALEAEDALARLVELGLLEVTGNESLRLHRLLAAFVRPMTTDIEVQAALLRQFNVESERSVKGEPYDDRFAYEVFRRALVEQNDEIWIHITVYYRSIIEGWFKDKDILASGADIKNIIDRTFMRFRQTVIPDKFTELPNLNALLIRLEECFNSIVSDYVRDHAHDRAIEEKQNRIKTKYKINISAIELYKLSKKELEGVKQDQALSMRPAYELFRKALVEQDEEAWVYVYALYSPMIKRWVEASGAFASMDESSENFVADTFVRLWRAITPESFENIPTLSALLAYLRSCATAVVIDEARSKSARERVSKRHTDEISDKFEDRVLNKMVQKDFWYNIDRLLNTDTERLIIYESFLLGLPPRAIYSRHPQLFNSTSDVSSIKRNILNRLRRNEFLHSISYFL